MANAGTLQILVVGDTDPLVSAMKKGEKATGSLNTAAGKLGMTLENINAPFERLKRIFGARGPLKDLTELAVGGGAFAGISFLTSTLERSTGKAKDLVTEFRMGTKTSGELADETLRLIPIFGDVYAAGRNIREIFAGDEAALAKVRAEADQLDKTSQSIRKLGQDTKDLFAGALDAARSFREETQRINLGMSGPGGQKQLIEFDVRSQQSRAIENLRKQLVDLAKEPKARLYDLQKQLAAIRNPDRMTYYTGGGGVGGTNGAIEESDAAFKARVDKVEEQRNQLRMQINNLLQGIEASRLKTVSGISEITSAATANIAAKAKELAKAQSDMAIQANNESMNAAFGKWLDKYNDAKERAKEIIKDLRTPAQQYADTLKELDDLLQRNMLTQQQYSQAVAGAKLEMATGQLDLVQAGIKPAIEVRFADAVDTGTAATSALAAKVAAAMGGSVASETEKKQLAELQKQVSELKELNRKLKVGPSN